MTIESQYPRLINETDNEYLTRVRGLLAEKRKLQDRFYMLQDDFIAAMAPATKAPRYEIGIHSREQRELWNRFEAIDIIEPTEDKLKEAADIVARAQDLLKRVS